MQEELSQEKIDLMNSPEAANLFDSGMPSHFGESAPPPSEGDSEEAVSTSEDSLMDEVNQVKNNLSLEDISVSSDSEEQEIDASNEATETLFVRGPDGKREALEIDYADRKSIKQAHLKAAGMRKFQRERDVARKELQESIGKAKEIKENYTKLEQAFESAGVQGITELLGGPEAWNAAIEKEMEHRNYVANLSATEKYQYESKQREDKYEKQLQDAKRTNEEFQQKMQETAEAAELKQYESKLMPAFDRYRVELDDPEATELINDSIWKKAVERIGAYPEDMAITKALVDKEFRKVASVYKNNMKKQVEKTVTKQISKKKNQAMNKAQVSAKKGLAKSNSRDKQIASLLSGDLEGAMKSMFGN